MLRTKIKFEDFDGNQQEAELHFNLTKTELSTFYARYEGGFDAYFSEAVRQGNIALVSEIMVEFVHMAYGQKSPDGLRFIKTPEDLAVFKTTAAYDAIMSRIMESVDSFLEFMYSVVPSNVAKAAKEETERQLKERKKENSED